MSDLINFNTSYVTVQHLIFPATLLNIVKFQYILCYGSTRNKIAA